MVDIYVVTDRNALFVTFGSEGGVVKSDASHSIQLQQQQNNLRPESPKHGFVLKPFSEPQKGSISFYRKALKQPPWAHIYIWIFARNLI